MSEKYQLVCSECGVKAYADTPITPSRKCTVCGAVLCVDCGKLVEGKLYCSRCLKVS